MTDTFVNDVTLSIRRSLFQRLKARGFTQDELTGIVAGATRAAVQRGKVQALADLASAAGPVIAALEAAAPTDPALATFTAATSGLPSEVTDLLAVIP